MGVPSSPGQAPPRIVSNSIGFYFGTGLVAPVSCLLGPWGLVTAIVFGGALDRERWLVSAAHGHRVLAEPAVVTGAGLVVVFTAAILMGRFAGRVRQDAESLAADVMRAAAAEVEDYTPVTVISDSEGAVAASAVTDLIHLLAELIENATLFSPSSTRVEIRAERVANGFAIKVEDRGLDIPSGQLAELNSQLSDPADFDRADADRLGLFVAGRLAARHGVHVSVCQSPHQGTKAVVVLPEGILAVPAGSTGPQPALREPAQLNLRVPEVLSMTEAVSGARPGRATTTLDRAETHLRAGAPTGAPDDEEGSWL